MTVVVQIPSQSYTPRTINFNTPSIPANTKKLILSVTRESWPAGEVGRIFVTRPDGSAGPSVGFMGGVYETWPKGTPVEQRIPGTGTVQTRSFFEVSEPTGASIMAGVYGVRVEILQTISTAVTVERF